MEITPKFYLREKNAPTTSIQLVINHNTLRLKYGIGLKIQSKYWDCDKQCPITDKSSLRKLDLETKRHLKSISDSIDQIRKIITRRHSYLIEQGIPPTVSDFKKQLDNNIEWKESRVECKAKNLNAFFTQYIEEMKNGQRTTDKGKKFALGTIKNYQGCLTQLQAYQKLKRRKIDFEDVTMDFYDTYVSYFNSKNYSPNTIGRHIKNLKTIMRASKEEGLHTNTEYERRKFRTLKVDTQEVYLSESEVMAIYSLNLSNNPIYDLYRDVFLVGVYTAQRYSDYSLISKSNITKTSMGTPTIKLIQKKTGTGVQIPIRPELEKIMNKYNYKLPKTYEQKLNKSIKEIAKLAGINEPVTIEKIRGGHKINSNLPKYEMIKSHSARRTGITNMYLAKIPLVAIQKVSGHLTTENLLKYIKVSVEENADMLATHHYFTQPLKAV